MTTRSYSTQSDPCQDDTICCGLFKVMTIAKVCALYIFVACLFTSSLNFFQYGFDHIVLSIVCVILTIHATVLVYGVFLENRLCMVPFLVVQCICVVLSVFAFFAFLVIGTATDFLREQHNGNPGLRELYKMHNLDPDNETVQTLGALLMMLFGLLNISMQMISLYVIYRAYNHLDAGSRGLPTFGRNGYMKGVSTTTGDGDVKDDDF